MAKDKKGSENGKLTTASVLAFERKLDPSDAHFSAGRWDERAGGATWPPVVVQEKSVRGTISNRLKDGADPAKLNAEVQKPNLQRVDVASLPPSFDTLKATFSLRVLAGVGEPSACNDVAYQEKLIATVGGYRAANGFGELAHRYASNLASGRFLWRNRVGVEDCEVRVESMRGGKVEKAWVFNATEAAAKPFPITDAAVRELGTLIADGLTGTRSVLLMVHGFARLGSGQECYPSQELILDKGVKDVKSKTLYVASGAAAIHSQKIGNALRTIDTWYSDEKGARPIAVEPYGSVTTEGRAYRQPSDKLDFYTLLDNWVLRDKAPSLEQQHFIMATLVRGGVFGEAGK